ncbi:MAG: universal stress protein [Gammaproteobacteria bacterium]|jgi:nucleotide-binding universal stress UspA family protein|nr:universal stress protein [Gammaproteobacteria bacterium]
MTASDTRRIVVALDASDDSLAALQAASKLAADLQAELLGLFVEDINLLRLAELPVAREVVYASRSARALDLSRLERALRMQAAELERALANAAETTNVRWSFRVARGHVATEVLATAEEADMLVLGRIGRSPSRRAGLGSTAHAAAEASCTVVLLERGVSLGRRVVVLFDGSEGAVRSLATAARLAGENEQDLIVAICDQDSQGSNRLRAQSRDWLREQGRQARFRSVDRRAASLIDIVRQERAQVLLVAADHPLAQRKTLPDLLNKSRCVVVLVR